MQEGIVRGGEMLGSPLLSPCRCLPLSPKGRSLEAQQRDFSFRAKPVAILSHNSFVHVLMGYRTIIARYIAKWVSHRCETKYQVGISHHLGGVPTPLKRYNIAQYGATRVRNEEIAMGSCATLLDMIMQCPAGVLIVTCRI